MNKSLTIVLPIHNAEGRLRANVECLLEVAAQLTPRFDIMIVDDGSMDDSFDIANEIAAGFPQVSVTRLGVRSGLGAAMEQAKARAAGEIVILHDGVSDVNADEVRSLYHQRVQGATMDDLRAPARAHADMVQAHDRLRGFQVLTTDEPAPAAKPNSSTGIGQIPPLPRPNYLGAVGDFARGE